MRDDVLWRVTTADGAPLCAVVRGPQYERLTAALASTVSPICRSADAISAVRPTRPAHACRCWRVSRSEGRNAAIRRDRDGHDAVAGPSRDVDVPHLAARQVAAIAP